MGLLDEEIILKHVQEVKEILNLTNGKLIKSRISPDDYFVNLAYNAPSLKYPEVGISKTVVSICELISTLLLDDTDETKSISKIIVMIFEYYFLVSPILFKHQGAKFINDVTFMKTFMHYIKSLCNSRQQAQKELENIAIAMELYSPIKDLIT